MISHHSFERVQPQLKRQSRIQRNMRQRSPDCFELIHLKKSPSLNLASLAAETENETVLDSTQKPSMRGRLCPFISSQGFCKFMSECPYSHTIEEARRHNQHFKTKICEFAAKGFCKKANTCRFAHSFSELSPFSRDVNALGSERVSSSVSTDATTPTQTPRGVNVTRELLEDDLTPISERSFDSMSSTRVCYVAPAKQRAVLRHRPHRQVLVPSAFHYVEQMERRKSSQSLLPTPTLFHDGSQMLYPYYSQQTCPAVVYGTPMVGYSMVMGNVVYED